MAGNYQRPWLPENSSRSSSSVVLPALCPVEGGGWGAISDERSEREPETFKTFAGTTHAAAPETEDLPLFKPWQLHNLLLACRFVVAND